MPLTPRSQNTNLKRELEDVYKTLRVRDWPARPSVRCKKRVQDKEQDLQLAAEIGNSLLQQKEELERTLTAEVRRCAQSCERVSDECR